MTRCNDFRPVRDLIIHVSYTADDRYFVQVSHRHSGTEMYLRDGYELDYPAEVDCLLEDSFGANGPGAFHPWIKGIRGQRKLF